MTGNQANFNKTFLVNLKLPKSTRRMERFKASRRWHGDSQFLKKQREFPVCTNSADHAQMQLKWRRGWPTVGLRSKTTTLGASLRSRSELSCRVRDRAAAALCLHDSLQLLELLQAVVCPRAECQLDVISFNRFTKAHCWRRKELCTLAQRRCSRLEDQRHKFALWLARLLVENFISFPFK